MCGHALLVQFFARGTFVDADHGDADGPGSGGEVLVWYSMGEEKGEGVYIRVSNAQSQI